MKGRSQVMRSKPDKGKPKELAWSYINKGLYLGFHYLHKAAAVCATPAALYREKSDGETERQTDKPTHWPPEQKPIGLVSRDYQSFLPFNHGFHFQSGFRCVRLRCVWLCLVRSWIFHVFTCVLASLYEGVSVRRSVGPSDRPSVSPMSGC